jgi:Domain of unknown function (DUF1911)
LDQSKRVRDARASREQLQAFISPYTDAALVAAYRAKAGDPASGALFRNRAALDLFSTSARAMLARYGRGDPIADLAADTPGLVDDWRLFVDTVRADEAGEGRAVSADPASGRATYLTHLWALSFPVLLRNERASQMMIESRSFAGEDAVLDGLYSSLGADGPVGESLLYPKPYAHLLAAMTAPPEDGAKHVRLFLNTWLTNVWKRSGWGDTHLTVEDDFPRYFGYWAVEAAAVVAARGIDDSSFRDHEYYPSDLVRFYRDELDEQPAMSVSEPREASDPEPAAAPTEPSSGGARSRLFRRSGKSS